LNSHVREGIGGSLLVRLALVALAAVGLGLASPVAAAAAPELPVVSLSLAPSGAASRSAELASAAVTPVGQPTSPGPDAPLASNRSARIAVLAAGAAAIAIASSPTVSLVYRRRRRA
jgi:hypothetical protein